MRRIILLGASGSIGTSTLEIIKEHDDEFKLVAFTVGKQVDKVAPILSANKDVKAVYVSDKNEANKLEKQFPNIMFYSGESGIVELIFAIKADMVVNALVGFVGLYPSIAAILSNMDLALANKEALVVGGDIINELLKQSKSKLYPIDSEHVALAKCLRGEDITNVERVILTASGGSFRHLSREQLSDVTVEDALNHPSWKMGEKITIDSATMMNKGFEIIEAHYLFGLPSEKIDIIIQEQSIIHALVEFTDGSYLADLGPADMKIPIAYALFEGKRVDSQVHKKLKLEELNKLTFKPFDLERYPAVKFAREALRLKGTYPVVLNAANEETVYAFLNGEIKFSAIEAIIEEVLDLHDYYPEVDILTLRKIDLEARKQTRAIIESRT